MIDWLTVHLVVPHTPIPAGHFIEIDHTGELKFDRPKALGIRGTHETTILLSTVSTAKGNAIRIDGNPLKFLQGHNLFGTDDWLGLLYGMYDLISVLNPTLHLPSLDDSEPFDLDLRRVDITYMFDLGHDDLVQHYIDQRAVRSRSRAAAGQMSHGTLYHQKNSRYWAWKTYAKGPEFIKRLPQTLEPEQLGNLAMFVQGKLREELTLRARELDRIPAPLHSLVPFELFCLYRGKIVTTTNVEVPHDRLAKLPRSVRATYYDWLHGMNVKKTLSHQTFYRHRRLLLAAVKVDISAPRADAEPDVRYEPALLEPKLNVTIPEWAKGTPLYYDPASRRRQLKLIA